MTRTRFQPKKAQRTFSVLTRLSVRLYQYLLQSSVVCYHLHCRLS